jgi:hypothetical protein
VNLRTHLLWRQDGTPFIFRLGVTSHDEEGSMETRIENQERRYSDAGERGNRPAIPQ